MERITFANRTTKTTGVIRLRFRLRDGRTIQLYHKSQIKADLKSLEKFSDDGNLKPRVSIYDENLKDEIQREILVMHEAYSRMKNEGMAINTETFEAEIDRMKNPETIPVEVETFIKRFHRHTDERLREGVISKARAAHYNVLENELLRFLKINRLCSITTNQFDNVVLSDFREFLENEHNLVVRYKKMYEGLKKTSIPSTPRNPNTIATKMKMLRSFFHVLEQVGEIDGSPFGKMDDSRRKTMMREKYSEPFSLTMEELNRIIETNVSPNLQETKDAFLVQCALGIRIGDFKSLSMANVGIDEGIPFVHYLPQKTSNRQKDNHEIKTPVLSFALPIVKKYQFNFPILRYVFGKSGFSAKIKHLLKECGIDRKVNIFNHETGRNEYLPIYEMASSKLGRKTFVDLMVKIQPDIYAAGLHSRKSDAVKRYTTEMTIHERFKMMCMAFGQPSFKVDDDLNMIENPTNGEDERLLGIVKGLNEEDREKLLALLTKQ